MSVALILLVAHRWSTVRDVVLPPALAQGFDEILIVGEGEAGDGYRFVPIPPVTATTVDGLLLRDVGAMVTDADTLVYLCDDHALDAEFLERLRPALSLDWGVLIPGRYTVRDDAVIPLPMGVEDGYCAGHGIVIRRAWVQQVPWLSAPRHPNWDVLHTRMLQEAGCVILASDAIKIVDVEHLTNPGVEPWR